MAAASLKDADVKRLVAADEEGHPTVIVKRLDAEHELVELLQSVVVASVEEYLVVTMPYMDAHDDVGLFLDKGNHLFRLLHYLLARAEDALEFMLGRCQIAGVVHGVPSFLESKVFENFVPRLVVGNLPGQSLVVVPAVATFQIPFMIKWEIDEWAMQQVGKVLYCPVVKNNDHPALLSNTLSHAGDVGPQAVARLSGGIADYSHRFFFM